MVDDQRVGVRDLNPSARIDYGKVVTRGEYKTGYEPLTQAGFLSIQSGRYHLRQCKFARIDHRDLDLLAPGFRLGAKSLANTPDQHKRGAQQIEELFSLKRGEVNEVSLWVQDQHQKHEHSQPLLYRRASPDEKSATQVLRRDRANETAHVSLHTGQLVFTGLPSKRKHMEFFFYDPEHSRTELDAGVFRAFIAVHEEQEKESETWKWRKEALFRGEEIPVFWLPGKNGEPAQIGLAMMFKLAADNSVHDLLNNTNVDHTNIGLLDLPTRIFGQVAKLNASDETATTDGFRTRVSFGWAEMTSGKPTSQEFNVTAARPKPSYVPSYIRQKDFRDDKGNRLLSWKVPRYGKVDKDVDAQYRSYMDWKGQKEQLRGWKRYPARPAKGNMPAAGGDSASVLHPIMGSDANPLIFEGCIRYHNLHPIELGALLWALTWGAKAELRHALGMGKPYGWGQVSIEPKIDDLLTVLRPFIDAMENAVPGWADSPQIKQLSAMADPKVGKENEAILRQMTLDPQGGENQFKDAKDGPRVLPEYAWPKNSISAVPGTVTQAKGYEPPKSQIAQPARNTPPPRQETNLAIGGMVYYAGEPVTVMAIDGESITVRYDDGEDEIANKSNITF